MKILGISAHYHDAAAALVIDGMPVAAVQEERLSRRKNDAAILTADGVGEWAALTVGHGTRGPGKTAINLLREIHFPHSLGMLYSTFTAYLGFQVNEGEYKVMGLASYGRPTMADAVRKLV